MAIPDLAARLRAIVRTPARNEPRELTYVPDALGAATVDVAATAAKLGGRPYAIDSGACVVVDRVWAPEDRHGRRRVADYMVPPEAPLAVFDPRLSGVDWARKVVFFDIETTGLSGGAGTIAFLVGCGWFDAGAFHVRQAFLTGPAGERALLDALARDVGEASLLVTFNGRTFDVPVMETRWAYHRQTCPTDDLAHFDMLPSARRLWGRASRRPTDGAAGCTLSALEQSVLGVQRSDDVPGFEIPSRYFQFLRTGDTRLVEGILEHNRHDLLSLAGLMAHGLRLASEGPEACASAFEQAALGRLYERAGDAERAADAYQAAAATGDRDVAGEALARLAVVLRREGRHDAAAAAWVAALDLGGR